MFPDLPQLSFCCFFRCLLLALEALGFPVFAFDPCLSSSLPPPSAVVPLGSVVVLVLLESSLTKRKKIISLMRIIKNQGCDTDPPEICVFAKFLLAGGTFLLPFKSAFGSPPAGDKIMASSGDQGVILKSSLITSCKSAP